MNQDKAGEDYWKEVWNQRETINKIDINYYTNKLLDILYKKYLTADKKKSICEIGCAMSQNLLYFNDYFGYQINGFDYEKISATKTQKIYKEMGYNANIYHHNFFDVNKTIQYDILCSFGVFEHFKNLDEAINFTKKYLKDQGIILTVIPYTKNDILFAHENNGYRTLFCDYYGIYQSGVVNIDGINNEPIVRKILAIPGKVLYNLSQVFSLKLDSKFNSPYIIYIGQKL